MILRLPDDEHVFPDPALADSNGLLAIGGDLSVNRLLLAYRSGIFPWFSEGDPICWYAPKERCVIFPEEIKISKSMKKVMKNGLFNVTSNSAFEEVIANCSGMSRRDQDGTWITGHMKSAYIELHKAGNAHSVEVWQEGRLVGGLYGVSVGNVFCGESMFSLVSNASKLALIWLCQTGSYELIDCQLPNDHLLSMGAVMIPNDLYYEYLKA